MLHTSTRTITPNHFAELLLAAVLAGIAIAVTPFAPAPRHAVRRHQPCLRAPGARPVRPRHYARLQGRDLVVFRATAGALVAITVLIAWHGFNLVFGPLGGAL